MNTLQFLLFFLSLVSEVNLNFPTAKEQSSGLMLRWECSRMEMRVEGLEEERLDRERQGQEPGR